jgi:hypothetical protein
VVTNTTNLASRADGRARAVIEINIGVFRPKRALEFLARDDFRPLLTM